MNSFALKFHVHDILYTLVSNSNIYFFELEDLTTFFIFFYVIFFSLTLKICHEIRKRGNISSKCSQLWRQLA